MITDSFFGLDVCNQESMREKRTGDGSVASVSSPLCS